LSPWTKWRVSQRDSSLRSEWQKDRSHR